MVFVALVVAMDSSPRLKRVALTPIPEDRERPCTLLLRLGGKGERPEEGAPDVDDPGGPDAMVTYIDVLVDQ